MPRTILSHETLSVSTATWSSSSSSIGSSSSESDYEASYISVVGQVERFQIQTTVMETIQETAEINTEEESVEQDPPNSDASVRSGEPGLRPFNPLRSSSPNHLLVPTPLLVNEPVSAVRPHVDLPSSRVAAISDAWTSAEASCLQAQLVESLADVPDDLGLDQLWPDSDQVQVINFSMMFSFLCKNLSVNSN